MSVRGSDLLLSTAPFERAPTTTPRVMLELLSAALLVLLVSSWRFGVGGPLLVAAACAGAVGTEWFFSRKQQESTLRDYSAVVAGVLLGLTLPPGLPLWMAFLGGVAGVGLGKLVWGGLGQNLFNPALVGRAFLQAAFPIAMTTWTAPVAPGGWLSVSPGLIALPLMRADVDAVSAATPLGLAKFESQLTEVGPLFFGGTSGSLGETHAALLLCCGVWLGARRIFDWRLPVATLASVALASGALHAILPDVCPPPQFMLLSGGLLFAAVFMVTDPVTTPTTRRGAWIFGLGVGALVVLIRVFGGLPEGVMYAVLLMNAVTPHINRRTQPRPFGG